MEEEIWKDIVGYEGKYQVSSLGRVKSLDYNRTGEEKVLKPGKDKNGYLHVHLYKNNKHKMFLVHRLTSSAFLPNPENKQFIDHINTVTDDNRVENLRWCTAKENSNNPISIKHFQVNAHFAGKIGKDHIRAKAVHQYSLDDKLIRKWNCIRDVQRELGFSHSAISQCCSGRIKTAYGFIWKYA